MRRQLLALALVAGVLTPAISELPAAAAPLDRRASAGIGVRLVDAPTASADDPRARSYIVDHLEPGAVIERRVEVANNSTSEAVVHVYPGAARITRGGFVGVAGHDQDELTTWTTATPEELVLAPQEKALVKVTIRVPADAPEGEQYGVVWAETSVTPTAPGGVTQAGRVGIRLYLSVGPGGAPRTDFEVVSLAGVRDENGVATVRATVRNTGRRALDLKGSLQLSKGPAGLAAGPFPVPVGTTLGIGESAPVLIPLDAQLPDGPWLTEITMSSGLTERSTRATLSFPSEPGAGPEVSTNSGPSGWTIAGAGFVLAVLTALVAVLVRRRVSPRSTSATGLAAPMSRRRTVDER